ncbi:M23 family metallopeptidase [Streptacidiphilus sp. N1-10]|uniref:M23 family metallopeptidase n=1 Tax=Streptacidiphilus jeojiensis TaxID=3229225 RepID=A0ABV6XHW7_9ACTN
MALAATGALAFATIGVPAMASATNSPAVVVGPVVSGSSADAAQEAAAPAIRAAQARQQAAVKQAAVKRAAAQEAAARAATVKQAAAAAPARAQWSAPIPGAALSEAYGVVDSEYAAGYHTGTDFAVDTGTAVLAVGDGTVVSAGWQSSYGNTVVIGLADGHYALYAHLSGFAVTEGQQVQAGDLVARSGDTGNSTGPHLHFEIRTSNDYGAVVDPLAFLRGKGVSDF